MRQIIITIILAIFSQYIYAKSIDESIIEFKKLEYGDYTPPIKVSDYDSFLYVYSLLLNYEITSPMPKSYGDKLNQLRDKCRSIGRMQTGLDFLLLNREFATKSDIERYERSEILSQYKLDVGTNCKAINDLLQKK